MRSRFTDLGCFLASYLLLTTHAQAQKLDNYGDPLPPGAVLRLGSTRLAASGGFTWLPDGKTLVTAKHGKVLFWDATTGRLTKELTTPIVVPDGMSFRYDLACSADGKKLVCAGLTKQICVWNLETGKVLLSPVPDKHYKSLETVAMDSMGTIIAAVDDAAGDVKFWESYNCGLYKIISLRTRYDGNVTPAFSANGKIVAVAAARDGSIMLAPVDGVEPPKRIEGVHDVRVHSLAFTKDGAHLVSAGAGAPQVVKDGLRETDRPQIRIWNAATMKMIRELPVPPDVSGGCLATLAPDDKTLISLHGDRTLVWDLSADIPPRALEAWGFPTSGTKLRIDPLGKYVAATHLSKMYAGIWDVATGKPLFAPQRHSSFVTTAAFSKQGRTIATGGADNAVHLWNAQTGEHLRTIRNEGGWIRGLAFHDGDHRLLVSAEAIVPGTLESRGALLGFDVTTGQKLFESELPERGAALSLSPTETLLAVVSRNVDDGGGSTKLRLFDPFSGRKSADVGLAFTGFENSITDFHWSVDGKSLLAACEDNAVRRIDAKTGEVLEQIAVPHLTIDHLGNAVKASVQSAVFLSPERVVTGSMMGSELICWNLLTGAKLWTVQPPQVSVRKLAGSPNGKLVACTSTIGHEPYFTHLSLWDVATQKQLADVELGQEDAYAMTFSPDGKRLLVGFTDGNALVYDVAGMKD